MKAALRLALLLTSSVMSPASASGEALREAAARGDAAARVDEQAAEMLAPALGNAHQHLAVAA